MVLSLWFYDHHVGIMEIWNMACCLHGQMLMFLCDYLSFFLWHLHCISFMHWHMELCRRLLAATVPVQYRLLGITMRLHTLLGMKAGDMAFALHMHFLAYGMMALD